jgi:hypothetical protein
VDHGGVVGGVLLVGSADDICEAVNSAEGENETMPGEGGGIELPELLELTEESFRLLNMEPTTAPL